MSVQLHAYIGLGSNLGDRLAALQSALDQLVLADGLSVTRVSEVYECPPWGYTSENPYLNAVVNCLWDGPPLKLLELCYKIETHGGRHRAGANAPRYYMDRSIDLDLLHIDGLESSDDRLILPHPRAHLRGFVLIPLADLDSGLNLHGKTVSDWISQLDQAETGAIRPVSRLNLPDALD